MVYLIPCLCVIQSHCVDLRLYGTLFKYMLQVYIQLHNFGNFTYVVDLNKVQVGAEKFVDKVSILIKLQKVVDSKLEFEGFLDFGAYFMIIKNSQRQELVLQYMQYLYIISEFVWCQILLWSSRQIKYISF
eukprot:TRINITY_DN1853_c0_g1_i4.p4 TRINITY_DN1853_c0_g1~~TRINITY_DN1853_c0_g1_i4.p4  ORF type:complete len:131 (+),score=1.09 TRINITY_DN1853_c0_g1_i4:475-867(+)